MRIDLQPEMRSSAARWAPLRRFIVAERRLGAWAAQTKARAAIYEFLRFGVKQAWACLFGGIMVGLLIGTHFWYPRGAPLARYDFLVIAAVTIQILLLVSRFETLQEAKVILLFHIVGTAMEIFKTSVGAWIYPEPGLFKICGVPLFTGFMYASIGSYMTRAWQVFDFRFVRHPPLWVVQALAVGVYVNFFAHYYVPDLRIALFAIAAMLFWRTYIYYHVWRSYRCMPLLLACFLAALFILVAENVGTLTGTWLYPNQLHGWTPVGPAKLGSWFLLLIVSYAMVATLNRPREPGSLAKQPGERRAARPDLVAGPETATP